MDFWPGLYRIIHTLSVLERKERVKNLFCGNKNEWSESYQSQLKFKFFQDLQKTDFTSIRSIIAAMTDDNSSYSRLDDSDSEWPDTWVFLDFMAGHFHPENIANEDIDWNNSDWIAVKSVIDENKNFHCDQFMQLLFDQYEKYYDENYYIMILMIIVLLLIAFEHHSNGK